LIEAEETKKIKRDNHLFKKGYGTGSPAGHNLANK